MRYRRIIREYDSFCKKSDKNCGKAFARLVRRIYGRKSGNHDIEAMTALFKNAVRQAENDGYVCFGGRIYKGRFTFHSVMSAAEIMENGIYREKKRISTALFTLLSPIDAVRAHFLGAEEKCRLLCCIFDSLDSVGAGVDVGKDFPLIYGGFRQYYGIDLLKDSIGWRQFCFLIRAMPENSALFIKTKKRAAEMPFEKGIERLFGRLSA